MSNTDTTDTFPSPAVVGMIDGVFTRTEVYTGDVIQHDLRKRFPYCTVHRIYPIGNKTYVLQLLRDLDADSYDYQTGRIICVVRGHTISRLSRHREIMFQHLQNKRIFLAYEQSDDPKDQPGPEIARCGTVVARFSVLSVEETKVTTLYQSKYVWYGGESYAWLPSWYPFRADDIYIPTLNRNGHRSDLPAEFDHLPRRADSSDPIPGDNSLLRKLKFDLTRLKSRSPRREQKTEEELQQRYHQFQELKAKIDTMHFRPPFATRSSGPTSDMPYVRDYVWTPYGWFTDKDSSATYIGYDGTVHLPIHKPLPVGTNLIMATSIMGQYCDGVRGTTPNLCGNEPDTLISIHGKKWHLFADALIVGPVIDGRHRFSAQIDDLDVWNYVPAPIIDALSDALGRNMQLYVMGYYLPFY